MLQQFATVSIALILIPDLTDRGDSPAFAATAAGLIGAAQVVAAGALFLQLARHFKNDQPACGKRTQMVGTLRLYGTHLADVMSGHLIDMPVWFMSGARQPMSLHAIDRDIQVQVLCETPVNKYTAIRMDTEQRRPGCPGPDRDQRVHDDGFSVALEDLGKPRDGRGLN